MRQREKPDMVAKRIELAPSFVVGGWLCFGCGNDQPEEVSFVYYVTGDFNGYRCEECCRELGLIW